MMIKPTKRVNYRGDIHWSIDGNYHHRIDGPAVIMANGDQEWWIDGYRHREDGPAFIGADGHMVWWVRGMVHREDGPAIIRSDGTQEWWIKGVRVDPVTMFCMGNDVNGHD